MKFQSNHQHYVGQIYREKNHLRKVTWVCGPFYKTVPYSYGIFSIKSQNWPLWTPEQLIRRGIVTR